LEQEIVRVDSHGGPPGSKKRKVPSIEVVASDRQNGTNGEHRIDAPWEDFFPSGYLGALVERKASRPPALSSERSEPVGQDHTDCAESPKTRSAVIWPEQDDEESDEEYRCKGVDAP
jgi:hypothetical protein